MTLEEAAKELAKEADRAWELINMLANAAAGTYPTDAGYGLANRLREKAQAVTVMLSAPAEEPWAYSCSWGGARIGGPCLTLAKCVREYLLDSMTPGTREKLREHVLSLLERFDREAPVREAEAKCFEALWAIEMHDKLTPYEMPRPEWSKEGSRLWGVKNQAVRDVLAARAAAGSADVGQGDTKTTCATDGSQKADGGQNA